MFKCSEVILVELLHNMNFNFIVLADFSWHPLEKNGDFFRK